MHRTGWIYWRDDTGNIEYAAQLRHLEYETRTPPGFGWEWLQTIYPVIGLDEKVGIAAVTYKRKLTLKAL